MLVVVAVFLRRRRHLRVQNRLLLAADVRSNVGERRWTVRADRQRRGRRREAHLRQSLDEAVDGAALGERQPIDGRLRAVQQHVRLAAVRRRFGRCLIELVGALGEANVAAGAGAGGGRRLTDNGYVRFVKVAASRRRRILDDRTERRSRLLYAAVVDAIGADAAVTVVAVRALANARQLAAGGVVASIAATATDRFALPLLLAARR